MAIGVKAALRAAFLRMENAVGRLCGADANPFHHLGALGWFFFWIVLATGVYLFIPYETSMKGAWESVQYITVHQWWLGGLIRSLHRYASDAMVVVVALHLVREYALDRYHGARWFAWFTGVPLLWLLFASGVTGYWLVWDELAQYLAVGTAEWLDWLGIFGETIARNFLTRGSLTDRFFTLLIFIHIAVPLFLLFGMWIHILRINHPAMTPPRALAVGSGAMLLVLSLVFPATSHPPADLGRAADILHPDWFFMALYPAFDAWGAEAAWALAVGLTLFLAAIPWLRLRRRRPAAAEVSLENCNGCGRCAADCPFGAVSMGVRSDGRRHPREAVVQPDLCTGCGICVGACPSSTPFRKVTDLVSGIELPDLSTVVLRRKTMEAAQALTEGPRIMVFGCDHGIAVEGLRSSSTAVLRLSCVGMLPPPFIDFVLSRGGVDGVVIAAPPQGGCYHRLGPRWAHARLAGEREPTLPKRTDARRVRVVTAGAGDDKTLARAVEAFRRTLGRDAAVPAGAAAQIGDGSERRRRFAPRQVLAQGLVYASLAALVGYFSAAPAYQRLLPDHAVIKLSITHAGERIEPCERRTAEELADLAPNMRAQKKCGRQRHPVRVELDIDGRSVVARTAPPAGLSADGASRIYERVTIPAGTHRVAVRLRDSGRTEGFDRTMQREVVLQPRQILAIDYREGDFVFK